MVLGLAKEHSLTFGLPFSAVQGSFSTFSVPLHLYQLTLELLVTFLATWKASMAAIRLRSSSFICQ